MAFFIILFLVYAIFYSWNVMNQRTMLDLSLKHEFRLSESEHKIAQGTATFEDKLKVFPKYFLGFFIQPQMFIFYIVWAIILFKKLN